MDFSTGTDVSTADVANADSKRTSKTIDARAFDIVTDVSRDSLLTEFGKDTLKDRYLLPGENYQDLFARVAPAYADNADHAQRIYDYISKLWFISTTDPDTGIDIYLGSGGAPEGVLAAAALRCVGGQMQTRLLFRNDDERARAHRWGIDDLDRIYTLDDLAKGDCIFAATGVTDGSLLKGVKRRQGGAIETESIVMRASSGTVRRVFAEHRKGFA